jgi:hypothetical protein
MIHFFTLDAISFAASALSISKLPSTPRAPNSRAFSKITLGRGLADGLRAVAGSPMMRDLVLTRAAVAATWNLAYGLALALRVNRLAPGDLGAFGAMVACYGTGNVIGAVFIGNMRRVRPAPIAFLGYGWMGVGFLAMGAASSVPQLGAASLLAAIGGPVNDVPYFDLLQMRYSSAQLPKVYRLVKALETGAVLLLMAASPMLLRTFSPRGVIAACGLTFAALGAAGIITHRK